MEALREIGRRHETLKKRIHNFRMPIKTPGGRLAVGCLYFFTPIIGGYFVMQEAISHTDENIGPQGELLRERVLPTQDHAKRQGTLAQHAGLQRILDRSAARSAAAATGATTGASSGGGASSSGASST